MRVLDWRPSDVYSLLRALAALAALSFAMTAAAQTCHIESATMRDGVKLATEVYLPNGQAGPFPTILQRTPYNRFPPAVAGSNCNSATFMAWAARGYAALNQDVRGRYRSQGTMNAMQQEARDGYDAIEWAAAQPWSTGKVGTLGGSYVGLTQWQPAKLVPPHLAAIAPAITASDYHDHWTYVNGVFDLYFGQSWMLVTFAGEQYERNLEAMGFSPADVQAQTTAWENAGLSNLMSKWVWTLPLTSFPEFHVAPPGAPNELAPYYYDWLAHPAYDAFWARLDVEPHYQDVKVPALNSGAWYDIFQVGTVRNFQYMRREAGTADARAGTKLVMNCCGHAGTSGLISWGPAQTDPNLTVRFFERYLKGVQNGFENEPAVHMDVLVPPDTGTSGTSFLLTADKFPLPGTRYAELLLASGGNANTRNGDGRLVPASGPWPWGDDDGEHGDEGDHGNEGEHGNDRGGRDHEDRGPDGRALGPPDRFTYDPANPVPTVGGNMCCNTVILPAAAQNQSTVELRDDVLVYTSAPLERDLAVIGPVMVKLWARSSAHDTDFTAKLVDVHLDGIAHNVLDRIVRARFRHGSKMPPSLIEPGKPYEYTIDLGNTATIIRKGHRVRVEISSSSFPHYARNLNTGLSNEATSAMQVAEQMVLHDGAHRSRLVLPVVPGVQVP
jgi:putative CocE/NonD family hydrolase